MLFADTSALYALLVPEDTHHAEATRAATANRDRREQVWTIDPALTELWLLLKRDFGERGADRHVRGLLDHGLDREPLKEADYVRCWDIAHRWSDQDFALTDRQAFAVMERTGRLRAWSYDSDFTVIRLGPRLDRSVDVVR